MKVAGRGVMGLPAEIYIPVAWTWISEQDMYKSEYDCHPMLNLAMLLLYSCVLLKFA